MTQPTVMITGGTGMVGKLLTNTLLEAGHKVIILSRNPKQQTPWHPKLQYAHWDLQQEWVDAAALAEADAIVHLAGAGVVAQPWTDAYKQEIVNSRVKSGALLVKVLQTLPNKVKTVVSASAIGYYGADSGGSAFVETDVADEGFLGSTCRQWEEAIEPVATMGKRLVIARIGIVLAREGGALPEFKKPLRFRVAGILGSGRQMVSWIHQHDLCRFIQMALEDTRMNGAYNAVAPLPVSNRQLTMALAKAMHGHAFVPIPVPALMLKVMMGARSEEVLKSTTVSSQKLEQAGFDFRFRDIESAVQQLAKG